MPSISILIFEFSANGGLILIDASVAEISQMMAS